MPLQSIEKGANFEVFTDGKQKLIRIDNLRISYPSVGKKKRDEGEDGSIRESWQVTPMLSKKTHVAAKEAFMGIVNELLAANKDAEGKPAKVLPENRCIKNGDDREQPEYAGHWVISCSEGNRRPAVRNEHRALMIDPERAHDPEYVNAAVAAIDEMFYGGCWASVLLRPWYFGGKAKGKTKTYPKRICCSFNGIKFEKDDTPFGNGRIDDSGAWGDESASSSSAGDGIDDDDDDGL